MRSFMDGFQRASTDPDLVAFHQGLAVTGVGARRDSGANPHLRQQVGNIDHYPIFREQIAIAPPEIHDAHRDFPLRRRKTKPPAATVCCGDTRPTGRGHILAFTNARPVVTADAVWESGKERQLMTALIIGMAAKIADRRRAEPPEIIRPKAAHPH